MTSAQDFITEYTRSLIAADPLKRQELAAEYAKKLEVWEAELKKEGCCIALDVMAFHLSDKAEMVSRDSLVDLIRRERAALQ